MKKFWNLWRHFWGTHYRVVDEETGKKVAVILIFRHTMYLKKSKEEKK